SPHGWIANTRVAGGNAGFFSSPLVSPLPASAACLSFRAFSPSRLASLAASFEVSEGGAAGGIIAEEGVGESTLVSRPGAALVESAAFAGSVPALAGSAGALAAFGGSLTGAVVVFAGAAATSTGALAGFLVNTRIARKRTRAASPPATMVSFFLSWTKAGIESVTVEVPGAEEEALRALGVVEDARSFMPSFAFCSAPSWWPTT